MLGKPMISLLLAALALCCVYRGTSAAVISIDFSSEWIKVALVKPGVPMEIVLNKESKRKTAAVVSLRNGERLFGDAASSTGVKYPKNAYWYLQLLVGQRYDSPLVRQYMEWFPYYDIKRDEDRGTVLFQHDADTVFSPEELVAMLFNHSKQIAQDYAGQAVRDVVITVPSFYSQAQRRAILHAARLVELNVLQLMSDNAAAALNYGLFRQASFNATPQYIMFYDMGAMSTTATIVEYRKTQVKEGSVANTHPQLTVRGTGFDRRLGGLEMDIRLRDYLAREFESQKKTTGSVYNSPRAMAKLLKEAKRVKRVLSANTDHTAQVEGLLEDVDFRTKVTREKFEELCSDLFDRVPEPVRQALDAAGMTLEEIESVVLVGGGTRVPRVQEELQKTVKKTELGKSLNTDEAVALGAVYQGAGLTKLFRVKKFIVREGNVYPIQVSFTRHTRSEDGQEFAKTVTRTLFHRSNALPQKKVLTFNRYGSDFAFSVFYGDLNFLSEQEKSYLGRLNISEVYLAGVGDALTKHNKAEPRGIKAHFRMDESGLMNLDNVEFIFEYPEDVQEEEQSTFAKIGSTLSSLFGVSSGKSKEKEEAGEKEEKDKGEGGEEVDEGGEKVKSEEAAGEEKRKEGEERGEGEEREEEEKEGEKGQEEFGEKREEEEDVEEKRVEESEEEEEIESAEPEHESNEAAEAVKTDDGKGEAEQQPESEEVSPREQEEESSSESRSDEESSSDEDTKMPQEEEVLKTPNITSNRTQTDKDQKKAKDKSKEKPSPTSNVVKVNLTAEVTVLDLPPFSEAGTMISVNKLQLLQRQDDEKLANEQARNNLESHIFETKDAMYSEAVADVSTEDQREVILAVLTEAGDWMEEEGYGAETKVLKDKLRELKKVSRALFKRLKEAVERPKLLATLRGSINISHDFVARMKNLSEAVQIFTEVEINTLETLTNETEKWINDMEEKQNATALHEEPVLLSYEIKEYSQRLDREILYLLNKLRSHPPPKFKVPPNATNTSKNATSGSGTVNNETLGDGEEGKEGTTPTEEEEPTVWELPEAHSTQTTTTESNLDKATPTPDEEATPTPDKVTPTEENHQEL